MSETIKYPVQSPLTLYATEGLRNAVLILEERGYNLAAITQFTSRYLQSNGFRDRVPMVAGIGASKGGIGKSTIAINLGHAFARAGLKTGIVDTDFCSFLSISS